MPTDKQKEASRANGRKSQGAVTPEGKEASSQNAVRHNLCTGHLVLLTNEDPLEFHKLNDEYMHRFQPFDVVERDLVHKMIAATWREKRVTDMETALFEIEMDRQKDDVDDQYESISPAARMVLALFGTENTKSAASLLHRYGATARRAYASAFRILRELQGDRFNRMPEFPLPLYQLAQTTPSDAAPATAHAPIPDAPPAAERNTQDKTPDTMQDNTSANQPAAAPKWVSPTITVQRRVVRPPAAPTSPSALEIIELPNEPELAARAAQQPPQAAAARM